MKKILLILLFFFCINVNASIVVMDADSGRILYSKDKDTKKLIASTTKIMTSIIALENGNLSDKYIVGDEIDNITGSSIYLKKEEEISLNDLLYGLMLRSGNDAAMTIASNVLNYDTFIAKMNIKAFKLGMNNTIFENPHGLNENTKNYSTANDMAILMRYAIRNEDFLKITSTNKYNNWYNKNELLSDYKYLISGKIGYTKASGQVYVSAATKNNKTLIIVSINEKDKFNLHKNLYEKYFDMYKKYKVLNKYTFSYIVSSENNDSNYHYYILNDFNMLLTNDEINDLEIKINSNNSVDIYLKDKLIHKEKLYKLEYKKRKSVFKNILSLFK